jgi:hypothetical protein
MSADFYRTVMGHRYYESTMPELVRQLARLNASLESLIEIARREPEPPAPPTETPEEPR